MTKKAILLSLLLALASSPHVSRSQIRRSRGNMQSPQRRDMERRREQRRLEREQRSQGFKEIQQAYEDEASQEALGFDADQWKLVKPKMQRIKELDVQPALFFFTYSFAGGSDSNSRSVSRYGPVGAGGVSRGRASVRGGTGGSAGGGTSGSVQHNSRAGGWAQGTGYASGSTNANASGYAYSSRGGAGPQGDRPVRKQVGELNLGWIWRRPSENKSADELSEGETACEELLDAIEADKVDRNLAQQRIDQLRRLRQARQREIHQIHQELRAIVTPDQEAKLILMGYLD
jgi:hypothetical protein